MAKRKKIPTSAEVEARRLQLNREKQEAEKQRVIQFLQEKTLKVLFTFQIGLEGMDFLVPTEFYQKDTKMHGNKFIKCLERDVAHRIDGLYDHNPEFTTNMFAQTEQMVERLAKVDFADFPLVNKMLEEFLKDKTYWRDNLVAQFNRLDADIKNSENE